MSNSLKKLFFGFTFNITLFLLLFIGIQNSTNKSKVNLLIGETINLPIGFIIGTSFTVGLISGGLSSILMIKKAGKKVSKIKHFDSRDFRE